MAKIPKKKRKKEKAWKKVKKTAKQECRTEEVGRFSSKAKGRDQMEVTLDRPWDLGMENVDLDQEDVADLSNSETEMDIAQILHNPGDKKDKADSITNEPKRLDKVNSEFSVLTRNREIYISLKKERETGVNQTIISTPANIPKKKGKRKKTWTKVKKVAKKDCRTEEVSRFSSRVNVSEHAYCMLGRGQMKATLDRPWDLGTENVDLDQEDVTDLSNSETEMDTAQILHNPGEKKDLEIVDEKSTRKRKCLENVEKPQTEAESSSFMINKTVANNINKSDIVILGTNDKEDITDLEIVDEKSTRKRKCLENVEKPQTETESSSFMINKTEANNINKSDIVIPGTNDKEDITAKPPDKKKKKRNIMTAGEKNYKGKLDDLDAKIRDLIRRDMIPMLPTGKLVCKFCGKEFWLARSLQKHLTFSHLEKGGQIYISAEENLAYHFERRIEEMKKGSKELSFEHQDKKMFIPKMHTSIETEINLSDNSATSDIEVILTKISCSNDQLLNTVYTTDIWYCRTCNKNFSGNNLKMQLQNHSCGHEFSVLYIYPQVNITVPSESDDIPSTPYPDLESFLMENGLVFIKSTDTSGIETQSNSGIMAQSNSEIETQSNSETEINNKVESISSFAEAAAAHVNESGCVVDSVNQVTSSVMNNSLNDSIIDNVPTRIQSKVGVIVSQVIDVLTNLSENTKERAGVSQVNRVPVSVCSITSEPPIVTKEPKSASKIAIEKMDVVDNVNRACNLAKDSNKDSYASDIQGCGNEITGIVEKFKEAFKLKFGQDIIKMRCPKCLEEVYLDDFDEHSCENIQLKNQVLSFCSGCKIGFLSESQLNAHTFFEHKDKSQDVNIGLDVQSDVNTRKSGS
ncbi:unnamed protein product [Mytilus coruscus]|uniref:C2H2-type domain-containing protein n=1 Tax=Mytilus coruscus TaxID=42192 RepID=A0A6J8BNG6_MYTCO|nr:unnamed protein product [Mytilus coruscus]